MSLLVIEHISNTAGSIIKTVIIVFFLANVIKVRVISFLLILFCFCFILNPNLDFGLGIVNELIQIIYFPVSFFFCLHFLQNKNWSLRFAEIIAHTVIFSSLFFILNIFTQNDIVLEQLEVLSTKFNDDSGTFLHFGFFDHPQVASKLYVLSVIVILFKNEKRLIDYLALILGIYLVYITYVRLGWLVLLFSFILFIIQQKSKVLKLFFLVAFSLSLFLILPLITERLLNFNDEFTVTSISSGRDIAILKTIVFLQDISLFQFISGSGYELVMNTIGYAHNRFFEVFVFGGLISFLLWVGIYIKIFKLIKPFLKGNYMVISIVFLIFNSLLFSHGFSSYLAILSAMAISSNIRLE